MKHAISGILESNRGGSIVNTNSTVGIRGSGRHLTYAASKCGVVGVTRTAAKEYGPEGFRVNTVCPGPVDTPIVRGHQRGQDSPGTDDQ
jgi:glucose 1-dehydrogenase